MEFVHISDVHYGMLAKHGNNDDIEKMLLKIVELCNERGSELLLISGDLFHYIPDREMLREIDYILSKLLSTKTFIIAGNHDYMTRGGIYENYTFESNTYVFKPGQEYCNGEVLGVNADIYGVSYDNMNMWDEKGADYFASKYPLNEDKVNILLLHGGTKGELDIDYKEFVESGFDYVALGHIHKKDILADNVAYAGSLLPLDHTETGEHGYIIGNIDEMSMYPGKRTKLAFVPQKIRRFEEVTVELNRYMTVLGVKERILSKICDESTWYIVNFQGVCAHGNVVLDGKCGENALNLKELLGDGEAFRRIVSIKDKCRPYECEDIEMIYRDNEDNIIGRFIEKAKLLELDEESKELVLDYGLMALLYGRGDWS